jgi:hypothetical protein
MVVAVTVAAAVAACASIAGPSESTVNIRTNPDRARCELKGRGADFAASVETPASLSIPVAAAPVTVTCVAAGHKPTVHSLDLSSNGWIWGNAGLVFATGGVAIIGALVDTGTGASRSFKSEAAFDLDADRPRLVKARRRDGGEQLDLQAR